MAPSGRGVGGVEEDAKDVMDRIGANVQKRVHDSAVDYINDLQGDLSKVRFKDETIDTKNICNLDHTKHTNVSWGVIHPCDNRLANLFTEESASQCSSSRINGNDNNSGSCAPYRKLQLCDYNLEKITDTNTTNTNNLLVDVLLAAKHEGDSLSKYIKEHHDIIPSSNVCTVLARSFADIGDIIRGKDLYVGNRKEREKEKLQNNLKYIFKKIYESLPQGKKSRYENDDQNYYKLREDWWNANRREVWKAITCNAPDNAEYFRKTCSDRFKTNKKCQCVTHDVPTNLDYVPQHLRWFEEWAEEFCRIKQIKLESLEKVCRGENVDGEKKYCGRYGFDCTETIRKRNIFYVTPECTNCLFECNDYIKWIDNKKNEFEKQKKKYDQEINRYTTPRGKASSSTGNNMYYDEYYKELQRKCATIDQYLNLLNKETKCINIEKPDKESKIDFNNSEKTFSHSEYCKPCPECGVEQQDNGKFRIRGERDAKCQVKNDGPTVHGVHPTNIDVLYSGEGLADITDKLKDFCMKNNVNDIKENEKWKCYYVNKDDYQCKMQTNNQNVDSHAKIMKFDEFFIFWVTYMLNDCIDWKKKITKCINYGEKWRCKNKCNNNCKCFEKWVKKKQDEWKHIKEQYDNQPGLIDNYHFGIREEFLKIQFLKTIEKAYGNEEAIKKIEEFLENKSKKKDSEIVDKRDIIDILLEHELDEAHECKDNNPKDEKCSDDHQDVRDEEDDLDEDETHYNPCSSQASGRYTSRGKNIAKQMHRKAKALMKTNSVLDGDNKLEGDISKAIFRNGGNGKGLDKDICKIDKDIHTNDSRTQGYEGPCTGKDGDNKRFLVGTTWQGDNFVNKTHKNLYIPPRRQHMCTSNLEKLNVNKVTGYSNVNDSFLGDVLLAANKQAQRTKDYFAGKKDDHAIACRSVRYSFADLGDIIRGRDLWDEDSGAKDMEKILVPIFAKIKEELPPGIQAKYKGDNIKKTPYKQLREDWWEANRRQVWNAMKCSTTKNVPFPCDKEPTPYDDYIPQRLRWMKEWAEWYCKAKKEEYKKLKDACTGCKNKDGGNGCMQKDAECRKCTPACTEYRDKIKEWEKQWNNMQVQYVIFDYEANTTAEHGIDAYSGAVGEKDKPVVAFLQELQKVNKSTASKRSKRHITIVDPSSTPKTPYSTAAGYIHQEAPYVECMKQDVFCEKTDEQYNENYTFKNPPPQYKDACICNTRENIIPPPPPPPPPPPVGPDVCKTVEEALEDTDTLQEACSTKYEYGREKFPNWKCISSGDNTTTGEARAGRVRRTTLEYKPTSATDAAPRDSDTEPTRDGDSTSAVTTTTSSGAICIPPRRRKLYVGKLEEWANNAVSPQGDGESPGGDKLLQAFIKSASVETFFLWDRYKKIKEKEREEKRKRERENAGFGFSFGGLSETSGITALQPSQLPLRPPAPLGGPPPGVGVAPDVGVAPGVGVGVPGAIPGIAGMPRGGTPKPLELLSGSLDSDSEQTPENQLQSGTIPPDFLRLMFYTLGDYKDILFSGIKETKSGDRDIFSGDKEITEREKTIKEKIKKFFEQSGTTPKDWWNKNGQHIWNGMICALTYEDEGAKDQPPQQDQILKSALLDDRGKKPKPKTDNSPDYTYENVKLVDNDNTGGAKSFTSAAPSNGDNTPPKLIEFVERPTYFRYLEEWGENFCKERKKRLEKIEEECKVEENDRRGGKKCSGYGEDCQDQLDGDPSTFKDLLCPRCGKHCRYYKKWIERKQTEYEKQKGKYETERTDALENSGTTSDKEFSTTLGKCSTPGDFLQKLKSGPCKNDNDNGENEIEFDEQHKTFQHTKHCDPCSQFKIDCQKGNCTGGATEKKCKNNGNDYITANDIANEGNYTEDLVMHVSDDIQKEFPTELKDACETAGVFKGIKENKWKCVKVCGYNVCKPNTSDGEKNDQQIIIITAFVKLWVENFLEDYNKIKKKLNPCTKNYQESTCISGCKDKCTCVGKWISTKKNEWGKIKERFLEQYKNKDKYYPVKIILEDLQDRPEFKNAIKPCGDLEQFQNSKECAETDSSKKDEDTKKKDIVQCLLDKLEKEVTSCPGKHSSHTQANCGDNSPSLDEEQPLEEENPVTQPNICPTPTQQPEETGETCTTVDEKVEEEPEQTADEPAQEPATEPESEKDPVKPAPAPKPAQPPKRRRNPRRIPKDLSEHPAVIPSLATSTLMWTVGIGFTALTYWWLKKKSKPPVDLLRVLNIPKGDYDIPTLKSSNRYIPYATDKYRGKRYIYVEGDTDEDKYMFMSDTTDVTSSESEYEELDINEIYPYQSPKYKTLIEVVLEPSKRDIQSDDTPSNKFTDNEWNQLKKDFISNMLQNTQNTEPNILHDNVDNNTHPTMSRHNVDQKPFIMSIHDRNLYIGEEYSYDMSTNSGENNLYSGQNNVYSGIDPTSDNRGPYSDKNDPISDNHHPYSGIDLINDALNGDYDIYDEILKRKENEIFGTNHVKHTSTHSVAKNTNSDPITSQLELFHKWLDRHRNMCDQWDKSKKEELLDKLKKEWNKENNNNSGKTYNSDNKPSHNHVLNTDVSIQIDMDNPKTKNEFKNMDTTPNKSTMDTMLDDLEKYNEPYYYDFYKDDIYYDVNDDDKASVDHINMDHNKIDNNNSDVPTKVQIEMNVINNQELLQNEYPISHM
ncbi:erythrocyte membrane protein 1, PfEMP1, putative [Plasmodium sp. gorilla clade G1]|nr:erythrocyte membrane protein 1, PfEMP1, putative [Plasmodium sp. gorilla clade G1]